MTARQRLEIALQELGIQAKRSLGQNFLVSDHVIEKIIEAVKAAGPDVLVEVGPGPGALTYFLRQMEKPLTLIELDREVAAYWRAQGLTVLEEDALRVDWKQFLVDGKKLVFVSNLPYQISSSIVIDRSMDDQGADHMVLMFQKEVAQRIRAKPSSEDYGLLSVISQVFWETRNVVDAGPRDFDPAPRVSSRVVEFARRPQPVANRQDFLFLVKEAFKQRRKLMRSNLAGLLNQKKVSQEELNRWLVDHKFKETARAEELSPAQFVELYEYINHSRK